MRYVILSALLTFSFAVEKVFVACEGNFYESNGSLWSIENENVIEYENNPLGAIVQSLYVHDNMLFVIVNGSSNIQVFNISANGLEPIHLIDTQFSGPREMIVVNNFLYFSNWYTADIKKLELDTWEIVEEISTPGLPEDLIMHNGLIYSSIHMDYDWTDGNLVIAINPETDTIINTFNVGQGPGDLLSHENEIYISRTYYDENWNAFYGTSKIDENGDLIIADYGGGMACGGSVMSYQNSVYRVYDGGIAKLDQDLNIMPDSRIGNFNAYEVYSAEVINNYIYFGLSDYQSPDEVVILDNQGNEVNRYTVGAIPTDFAIWESCNNNGDINNDNEINVVDIIDIVNLILANSTYECAADINNDGIMNIVDVILLVQEIIGIDSFRGAANWLRYHFPELNVNERIKTVLMPLK